MTTVRDKLRSVIAERRAVNKRDENTSGVEEVIGPTGDLLGEFLAEVDDGEEEKRFEREKRSLRETNLTTAREQIQRNVLTRRQSVGDGGTGSTISTPRKRYISEDGDN